MMTWWFDIYDEFIKNFEKINQLQRDYIINLERINYLYNESINSIERVNYLYNNFTPQASSAGLLSRKQNR